MSTYAMHSVHFNIDSSNGLGKLKIAIVGQWKEDFDLLLWELEGLRERLY